MLLRILMNIIPTQMFDDDDDNIQIKINLDQEGIENSNLKNIKLKWRLCYRQ